MRALACCALALALVACTPNGTGAPGGSSGASSVTHVVDINLTLSQPVSTKYGLSGAFTPAVLTVKVGDSIVFKNTDSFGHTSSIIPTSKTDNETKFPSEYPFSGIQQSPSGSTLSGGWTSGVLQAGATSQVIHADKAGTYLYGCEIHYGAPMRAAIVAQ
jgi:plastocyanin